MIKETATVGREAWVAAVLARYEAPLLHRAARITGNMDLARDVVQDTFLQLCLANRGKIESHLAGWLFTVCRNRALKVRRKEARMIPLDKPAAEAAPARHNTLETAARNETHRRVLEVVGGLPQNQQEAFQLKFRDGLTYREISEIMGVSLGTVSNLMAAALDAVRRAFPSECGGTQEA